MPDELKDLSQLPDTFVSDDLAETTLDGQTVEPSADMLANFDAAEADTPADESRYEKPDPVDGDAGKDKPKKDAKTPEKRDAKQPEGKEALPDPAKETAEVDPELDAIKEPKGAHPKTLEGFRALKAVAAEKGKQLKETLAKVAELEAKVEEAGKVAPLNDEERTRLKTAEDRLFMLEPENSAIITREYRPKMDAANESAFSILASLGVPETEAQAANIARKQSEQQGGKEVQSGLSIEAMKKAGGIKSMPPQWWEQSILENKDIDWRTRNKLREAVTSFFDNEELSAQALEKAPKDRESYEKVKQAAAAENSRQYHAKAVARAGAIQKDFGPWAQEQQIPPNASPEQKANIEASNKRFKEVLAPAFVKNMNVNGPEEHADLAMGKNTPLALYYQGEAERQVKLTEIARKEADDAKAELSKIKSAGKISGRSQAAVPVNKTRLPTMEEAAAAAFGDS